MAEKIVVRFSFSDELHEFDKLRGIVAMAVSSHGSNDFDIIKEELEGNTISVMLEPHKPFTHQNFMNACDLIRRNTTNDLVDSELSSSEHWESLIKNEKT